MKDPRYHGQRWRKTAKAALVRDGYICRVTDNCPTKATVADHIQPVYAGMPDHEFYAMSNLRASCRRHNWARGVQERLERETAGVSVAAPSPYSFGGSRFFRTPRLNDVGSPGTELEFAL